MKEIWTEDNKPRHYRYRWPCIAYHIVRHRGIPKRSNHRHPIDAALAAGTREMQSPSWSGDGEPGSSIESEGRLEQDVFLLWEHSFVSTTTIQTCYHWLCLCFMRLGCTTLPNSPLLNFRKEARERSYAKQSSFRVLIPHRYWYFLHSYCLAYTTCITAFLLYFEFHS